MLMVFGGDPCNSGTINVPPGRSGEPRPRTDLYIASYTVELYINYESL